MSLYEKTVYPQLAGSFATADLERYFTPTAEEIDFADKGARSPGFRLTLLTLLKLFQMLHRFPAPDEIPSAVVNHLRIHLRIGEQVAFENGDAVQRARQYRAIANTRVSGHGARKPGTWPRRRATKQHW